MQSVQTSWSKLEGRRQETHMHAALNTAPDRGQTLACEKLSLQKRLDDCSQCVSNGCAASKLVGLKHLSAAADGQWDGGTCGQTDRNARPVSYSPGDGAESNRQLRQVAEHSET